MITHEERVRKSFGKQAFMSTLGAELTSVGQGVVEIRLPFSSNLTQQDGYVHAGAVTSILDSACGYAALTIAPANHEVLTVEFKVNLLAPAVSRQKADGLHGRCICSKRRRAESGGDYAGHHH